jgi:hypothetical protein
MISDTCGRMALGSKIFRELLGNKRARTRTADRGHRRNYISRRRPVRRSPERQGTLPGLPLPEPNLQRVGRLPKRREQRSPDRQASYDRRHRLAYSGVMPHHLAARLTVAEMAVMRIVADEYVRAARCELTLDEIAARAGMCRRTARRAMRAAREGLLISVEQRPVPGQKHRPQPRPHHIARMAQVAPAFER